MQTSLKTTISELELLFNSQIYPFLHRMDFHFRMHPIILSKYAGSGRQSSTQKLGQDTQCTHSFRSTPDPVTVANQGLVGDSLLEM